MIDLKVETLITFAELARGLPRRRCGRPVHVSTPHRWRKPGLRGVQLDAIRIGGAWHTSMEAFSRFCARLTDAANADATTGIASKVKAKHGFSNIDEHLASEGW